MPRISLHPLADFVTLEQRWRALETQAPSSFFRSWTFLGCQAETRFAGASLLSVTQDGTDVALAILGRASGAWWLNQTGTPQSDAVFIEHNGLLGDQSHLAAAVGGKTIVLSGIDDATLAAAKTAGWLEIHQQRWAPAIALNQLTKPYLETLSANARAQIRRSQRLYGPDLALAPATTLAEAQAFFQDMVALHQTAWTARGRPGAFANPAMLAFHTELIARAWPLRQADLLRVTAGPRHIGTLYNLLHHGRVSCYQSGFAYAANPQEKPGLCCHALAIAHYAAAGHQTYDLLAGADRYKLTLATGGEMLHWATLHRPWSPGGLVARAKAKVLSQRADRQATQVSRSPAARAGRETDTR